MSLTKNPKAKTKKMFFVADWKTRIWTAL